MFLLKLAWKVICGVYITCALTALAPILILLFLWPQKKGWLYDDDPQFCNGGCHSLVPIDSTSKQLKVRRKEGNVTYIH